MNIKHREFVHILEKTDFRVAAIFQVLMAEVPVTDLHIQEHMDLK